MTNVPDDYVLHLDAAPALAVQLLLALEPRERTVGALAATGKSAVGIAGVRLAVRVSQLVQPSIVARRLEVLGVLGAVLVVAVAASIDDEGVVARGLPDRGDGEAVKGPNEALLDRLLLLVRCLVCGAVDKRAAGDERRQPLNGLVGAVKEVVEVRLGDVVPDVQALAQVVGELILRIAGPVIAREGTWSVTSSTAKRDRVQAYTLDEPFRFVPIKTPPERMVLNAVLPFSRA